MPVLPALKKRWALLAGTVATVLFIVAALMWGASVVKSPSFIFLVHEDGAEWIRYDRPFDLTLRPLGTNRVAFRTMITLDEVPGEALVRFRALKLAHLELDGKLIYLDPGPLERWKRTRRLDLASALTPGTHTLTFVVENENGPSALLAYSDDLGFASGEHWESSRDLRTWTRAVSVDRVRPSVAGHAFLRSDRSLLKMLPYLLPVFLGVGAWRYAVLGGRFKAAWLVSAAPSPGAIRWALIAALTLLGANNIFKIPAGYGFDIVGHMEYFQYLVENRSLPTAIEGWKMNEAPLFYLVGYLPYSFIYERLSADDHVIAMRVIPLLCGVAQVELVYRSLRYVYPTRPDLQALGTVIASLIPINLYMSQFVGNQPFVAFLASLLVLLALRFLHWPEAAPPLRASVLIGLVLGLALLAKLTAVLLIVPLGVLMVFAAYRQTEGTERSIGRILAPLLVTFAIAGVVSGWYYVRNMVLLGTPFAVGYSEELGIVWRQDPGFRTLSQFTHFGEALLHPVFAHFHSYWDSLYCTFWADGFISGVRTGNLLPPWNFTPMYAGALLGLLPGALIAAGVLVAVVRPVSASREGSLFAVLWLAAYLAGMLYFYLTFPVLSTGKAIYLLNLLPCFGILAAGGFKLLHRSVPADPICCGALACWAVTVYAAFFVL